jgi:hypothetical protein
MGSLSLALLTSPSLICTEVEDRTATTVKAVAPMDCPVEAYTTPAVAETVMPTLTLLVDAIFRKVLRVLAFATEPLTETALVVKVRAAPFVALTSEPVPTLQAESTNQTRSSRPTCDEDE